MWIISWRSPGCQWKRYRDQNFEEMTMIICIFDENKASPDNREEIPIIVG